MAVLRLQEEMSNERVKVEFCSWEGELNPPLLEMWLSEANSKEDSKSRVSEQMVIEVQTVTSQAGEIDPAAYVVALLQLGSRILTATFLPKRRPQPLVKDSPQQLRPRRLPLLKPVQVTAESLLHLVLEEVLHRPPIRRVRLYRDWRKRCSCLVRLRAPSRRLWCASIWSCN